VTNPQQTTTELTPLKPIATGDNKAALLGVYEEICKSHQAIDEFRMKLLGLLPLASLAGIFILGRADIPSIQPGSKLNSDPNQLVSFIAIFAALFTLALYVYEIRGILRCHNLVKKGSAIEEALQVSGQFSNCKDEHNIAKTDKRHAIFNAIVAACFIYSLVFAAWVFLALHNGFGLRNLHCMITAPATGLALGLGAYLLMRKQIPS
jgi:drug/metabolite transporter (DMT)-like permease